ncbi:hypothetical protein GCM10022409_30800 [Hymenobacter glaciei]|uniref:GerMN domain-containing protein n=1 Tax=Hymenobacter glaciei TaxID=877209 RepID=A0ABP7UG68_9BACT
MNSYCVLFFLVMLLAACGTHDQSKNTSGAEKGAPQLGIYVVQGDSVVVPPFAVEVRLSDKANQELAARKETIIVAAYLEGVPARNNPSLVNRTKEGGLRIGEARVELRTGRTAKFAGIRFARPLYDQLGDKDLNVLVNVFSGRKSTENNLLSCTIIQEKIGALAGQTRLVTGHLIEGDD